MTEAQIMKEIEQIKSKLGYLEEHMVDWDSIMTEEDYEALLAYREEKKSGKLISEEELEL